VSNLPSFWILAFVGGTCAPPSALLVSSATQNSFLARRSDVEFLFTYLPD